VACRHHVMEVVLSSVFSALFGHTGGSDVAMFKRFQQRWPYIDQSNYHVASDDMFDVDTTALRGQMVKFCQSAFTESHLREDYREFLQLCSAFLGGKDMAKISFTAPGALH